MKRPAWIETDLKAIAHNMRQIRRWVGPNTDVLAVVKANAYGHGLVEVANTAVEAGARMLGVAQAAEALALRRAGVGAPILVMGCALPEEADALVALGVSAVVTNTPLLDALASSAKAHGKVAGVHVKVDTGMGRAGVAVDEAVSFTKRVLEHPALALEGVMTHFATADQPEDLSFARTQWARFRSVLEALERKGIRPKWRHAANSGAIRFLPDSFLDLVRPGLLLYGIPPAPHDTHGLDLKPALALMARVTQLRAARPGETISYGRTFTVQRPSKLAVVPVGYADGYSRAHSNSGAVLVGGRRVPIVGRVCMDQLVVDVTDLDEVRLGDEVVLIGRQVSERMTVWDVAASMGSIAHEVLSALGPRLPRVFVR